MNNYPSTRKSSRPNKEREMLYRRKTCNHCGLMKHYDEYSRREDTYDGLEATCKNCRGEKEQKRYDPIKNKDRALQRLYRITLDEFNEMLCRQWFKCIICGCYLDGGRNTHVDHCHTCNEVRGLLCTQCNTALGLLQEDPSVIATLLDFVEEHQRESHSED